MRMSVRNVLQTDHPYVLAPDGGVCQQCAYPAGLHLYPDPAHPERPRPPVLVRFKQHGAVTGAPLFRLTCRLCEWATLWAGHSTALCAAQRHATGHLPLAYLTGPHRG